jgi:hypothetical protein
MVTLLNTGIEKFSTHGCEDPRIVSYRTRSHADPDSRSWIQFFKMVGNPNDKRFSHESNFPQPG